MINILGINFTETTYQQLIKDIVEESQLEKKLRSFRIVHFVNAFTVTEAHRLNDLKIILNSHNGVNFADGRSIVHANLILRKSRDLTQIRGLDFMKITLESTQSREIKHAIVGGTSQSLHECVKNIMRMYPGASIPLAISPPFSSASEFPVDDIASELLRHNIDICWLALGTPKQDLLAPMLGALANTNIVCIGAAVDYLSGELKQPSTIVINAGLEWFFRFLEEPRRLFTRYFIGLPKFLGLIVLYKVRFRKNS